MIIDWTYYSIYQFNSYFGIGNHIYNYLTGVIIDKMLIGISAKSPTMSASLKIPGASFGTKVPGIGITGKDGDA